QVQIELFGENGSRVDEISGDTFDYDQKSGLAIAEGPVEMVLTRPEAVRGEGTKSKVASAAGAPRQIHLTTSGVTFDQDTGLVATAKRVDFTMAQGSGSAIGAMYDSQNGYLTLDHAVNLNTERGKEPVNIQAQHAELDRSGLVCTLRAPKIDYRGGQAAAAMAKIQFRADGTAKQLEATGGFTAETATGGHLTAPTAQMDFDEHNQPRLGHLAGGVTMDSSRGGRTLHGTSPTAELAFTAQGQLLQAHLQRGVVFESDETDEQRPGQAGERRVSRTWRSPVADVNFNDAGNGRLELGSIHGTGGVVITSDSRRGGAAAGPSKMIADDVTGTFTQGSILRKLIGTGHAAIEQTTATGVRQTANGDRLEAQFAPEAATAGSSETTNSKENAKASGSASPSAGKGAAQVESAEVTGHVVLFEQPAVKSGVQPHPPMRATAGKAIYEGTGQWLHLTLNPRVEDGGLELTADKVDISQQSGDGFAHGNVKATWTGTGPAASDGENAANNGAGQSTMTLGGRGPAHVVAAEAELNESTGEATFSGHARLWQMANSVSGPVIVLNQHLQTLVARSSSPSDPVRAVLLSAGQTAAGKDAHQGQGRNAAGNVGIKSAAPAVIRVRGGELLYSEAEHRAVMRGGAVGAVVAETGTATSSSDTVDLRLMPGVNPDGNSSGQTQVDQMTATGHVTLTSQGRRGSGEQLQYSSVTGEYVLTGTVAAPPKLTDPGRGTVTGEALIFNSRDDSVSIEGGGRETITETTAPRVHIK
ncbi:MAG: LptA/OstA family protein, partial [Terracidiphilus sp.]